LCKADIAKNRAIYDSFRRQRCQRLLREFKGRFSREVLDDLFWDESFTAKELDLFIGFMETRGAFYRIIPAWGEDKEEYLAPELFPTLKDIKAELYHYWQDAKAGELACVLEYDYFHPGLIWAFIRVILSRFRYGALHWKDGLALATIGGDSARVDAQYPLGENLAYGQILIRVNGPSKDSLMKILRNSFS
jgi:internalin A